MLTGETPKPYEFSPELPYSILFKVIYLTTVAVMHKCAESRSRRGKGRRVNRIFGGIMFPGASFSGSP